MTYEIEKLPIHDKLRLIINTIRKIGIPFNDIAKKGDLDPHDIFYWRYFLEEELYDEYIEPQDVYMWLNFLEKRYPVQFGEMADFYVGRNKLYYRRNTI